VIDIQVTGTMMRLNDDFAEPMGEIGLMMFDSVQQNFFSGGRPDQWEPIKKTGMPSHLFQSGALLASIQMSSDSDSAKVFIDTSRMKYAAIHNFGGGIVFDTHTVNMPQRQFMMFQEEDKAKILQILSNAIFTTSERIQ
jgi:phage virion morphogenesis protein